MPNTALECVEYNNPTANVGTSSAPIIVVGTGPVGVRVVQEIVKRDASREVYIFGDEPWRPYNRVLLSSLLNGESDLDQLYGSAALPDKPSLKRFFNNRIVSFDPSAKTVLDSEGVEHAYSKLILATGSSPRVPRVEGSQLNNVFTFRNLNDAQALMGRSARSRHTVVVGGGLLGLEAARAMQRHNTQVTVLEHSDRLMFYQLDEHASAILNQQLVDLGVTVMTKSRVERAVEENGAVRAVLLADGTELPCDTLVFAAGIEPNIGLAKSAGLAFDRAIKVDDQLATSHPDVFAIGECAQHNGQVYGLVAPGFEQAAVLAENLTSGLASYRGSTLATNLKVVGLDVFSAGDIAQDERPLHHVSYHDADTGIYRKIVLMQGKLVGAVGIGEWPNRARIRESITQGRSLWSWQLERFRETGSPWEVDENDSVANWPADTLVCNCMGVTRGTLTAAMKNGACSAAALCEATGASSVCGSCQPLLQQLSGSTERNPVRLRKPLLIASVLAAIAFISVLLTPSNTWNSSVILQFQWDQLWRDGDLKEISGYSILAVSVIISLISLRKRLVKFSWGEFLHWRLFHVFVGVLLVAVLFAHTGFRFGANLNLWLMTVFTGLVVTGAALGLLVSDEHRLNPSLARVVKRAAVWCHILLLWPLPALLGMHILKSYYF